MSNSTNTPTEWQLYKDMFLTFLRVGAFTLGGGYAMIPLIEAEVLERHRWVERQEFMDLIALAQASPGVFAINMSVSIGQRLRGFRGACCTALGAALPSFIIILLIALSFRHLMDYRPVAAMFAGIRPAVVALIASPTFRMAQTAHISLSTCWIPLLSVLLIWGMHVSPIWIILAAGIGGWLYGKWGKAIE